MSREDIKDLLSQNNTIMDEIVEKHPPVVYEDDMDELREKGQFEIDLLYRRARKKVDKLEKDYNKQLHGNHNARMQAQKRAKTARKKRR